VIGDTSAEDDAKFAQRQWLLQQIDQTEHAFKAFDAQAEYADTMADLHKERLKQLRRDLKDLDLT